MKQVSSTVLAFALIGPPIGNLTAAIWIWIMAALSGTDIPVEVRFKMMGVLLPLPIAGVPFAYVLGFIPALITGALFAALTSVPAIGHASRHWRAGLASLIAAAVCICWLIWQKVVNPSEAAFFAFTFSGMVAAYALGFFWPRQKTLLSNKTIEPTR
jgi:hypothetical protein